jgi:hypothetical protein
MDNKINGGYIALHWTEYSIYISNEYVNVIEIA